MRAQPKQAIEAQRRKPTHIPSVSRALNSTKANQEPLNPNPTPLMAGEPLSPAAGAAETESEAEAASLLALSESELSAGRLRAARKHARRAALLDPACPRAALILTAASVLLADESSHRAVLLLPSSPLTPSALRRHFKSLAKSLRPRPEDGAASSPAVAAAAEEALSRAAAAYEALTAPEPDPAQATFWTACAGCRLLHEFERRYLGYRLMCPSCRRTFLATEVPPPPESGAVAPAPGPANKKLKTEKPEEMTLAEMQNLLAKKRRAKDRKAPNRPSSRREVEEEDIEEEEENNHSELMAVEDSDFYNFDADRSERCIKKGQVWALYGDDDGMPRHYAVVDGVLRGSQFRAQVRWLDGDEGKPCGQFKVGRLETLHSVNVFSHLVACERAALELYRVYPRKRSVWALREDGEERIKHEIVVFLSGYSDLYGASFGYLKKVEGFKSIFTRRDVGSHAVHTLQKGDLGALSHQIPARMVSKDVGSTLPPGDCWELDPASLPSELLRVGLQS